MTDDELDEMRDILECLILLSKMISEVAKRLSYKEDKNVTTET